MWPDIPRIYPLLGLVAGYAVVMLLQSDPARVAGRLPLHDAFQTNLAHVHLARRRLFGLSNSPPSLRCSRRPISIFSQAPGAG